jgi:ADP-ribose pyrophosphatase YjhB (NUDIX family)
MTPEYKNPRLRVALIARDDGKILMLQPVREHGNYWVLPGGGVDRGEPIEKSLEREIMEELGVGCRIGRLVAIGELIIPGRHVVDFFFTGKLERNDDFKVNYDEGIGDARWLSPDGISTRLVLPPEILPLLKAPDMVEDDDINYLGRYKR